MRALICIALGLFFTLQTSVTTKTCSKIKGVQYYIHNDSVDVKTYYCAIRSSYINNCDHLGLGYVVSDNADIIPRCYRKLSELKFTQEQIGEAALLICESEAKVELLKNEIKFVSKEKCSYTDGYCKEPKLSKEWIFAFWTPCDLFNNSQIIYENNFEIWMLEEENLKKQIITGKYNKYIGIAMELADNKSFCAMNIWKTNINGVVASDKYIKGAILEVSSFNQYTKQFRRSYNSVITNCEADAENKNQRYDENFTSGSNMNASVSSSWYYLYNFSMVVGTYHCFFDIDISCKELKLGRPITEKNITDRCIRNKYKIVGTYKNGYYYVENRWIKPTVCEQFEIANLLTDTIYLTAIKTNWTYSASFFPYESDVSQSRFVLWFPFRLCQSFEKQYLGSVPVSGRSIVEKKYNFALKLVYQCTVCSLEAWYTDQPGTVAVKEEIIKSKSFAFDLHQNFSPINCEHFKSEETTEMSLDPNAPLTSIFPDDERVTKMKKQLHYLTIGVIVCILFIVITSIINIYVNFLSLRRASKAQENINKLVVLKCLSQSLTTRCLLFDKTPDISLGKLGKPAEVGSTVDNLHSYDYIDVSLDKLEKPIEVESTVNNLHTYDYIDISLNLEQQLGVRSTMNNLNLYGDIDTTL